MVLIDESPPQRLVIGRIGGQRFAWLVAAVERILPMAEVTRVVGLPTGVAGLLDVGGDILAVVDPRLQLGQPTATARPDQHLMLMADRGGHQRYLLWVDAVEDIVSVGASDLASNQPTGEGEDVAIRMIRVDGQMLRILSGASFSPSCIAQPVGGIR